MTERECSSEGCHRTDIQGRGLCGRHYQNAMYQFRTHGIEPPSLERWSKHVPRLCKHPGCDRPHVARGYCMPHWRRWKSNADMDSHIKLTGKMTVCCVESCDRPAATMHLCGMHYQRHLKGRPLEGFHLNDKRRPTSFRGAHERVRRLWGSASQYSCVTCPNQARDWAYDGADPTQLLGVPKNRNAVCWYSLYPEFYMPLCKTCHVRKDTTAFTAELREYRNWKLATGLTINNIPFPESYTPTQEEREEAERLWQTQ